MVKPGWMGSTGIVDAGDPPDATDERCPCDAFNEAVNDEVIYWHPADEDDFGCWMIAAAGESIHDKVLNFCPFCGKLVPLTAHSGLRPKAQTDAGDRNVLGHTGQMRERYTRRRKLVPVR